MHSRRCDGLIAPLDRRVVHAPRHHRVHPAWLRQPPFGSTPRRKESGRLRSSILKLSKHGLRTPPGARQFSGVMKDDSYRIVRHHQQGGISRNPRPPQQIEPNLSRWSNLAPHGIADWSPNNAGKSSCESPSCWQISCARAKARPTSGPAHIFDGMRACPRAICNGNSRPIRSGLSGSVSSRSIASVRTAIASAWAEYINQSAASPRQIFDCLVDVVAVAIMVTPVG